MLYICRGEIQRDLSSFGIYRHTLVESHIHKASGYTNHFNYSNLPISPV